jgi:transposase-like protein
LDDAWCQAWVTEKLHQNNARCPRCGKDIPEHLMHSFRDCKRIRCAHCGKYFTALTDTFLSGCHLEFREIVLLSFLLALDVADKRIATILKISPESVRIWKLKFNG